MKHGPEYKDPTRPYTTWTVKELREWLRVRGLPNKGTKRVLLDKIRDIMLSSNVPQPLPPKGGHVRDIMFLTQALAVMIAHIMQREVNDESIQRTKFYIKLFLSAYHEVNKYLIK